jgi:hypothetical protein
MFEPLEPTEIGHGEKSRTHLQIMHESLSANITDVATLWVHGVIYNSSNSVSLIVKIMHHKINSLFM